MYESAPYRDELARYAASFEVRRERQLWREDSLAKAEKMLFVGFFLARMLIECSKVTDACARSSVLIFRTPIRRAREVSAFKRGDLEKDLANVDWREAKIDINQLADKLIHAWWTIPVQSEDRGLEGYILTTDRMRNSELWLVPINSIVDVFARFAESPI